QAITGSAAAAAAGVTADTVAGASARATAPGMARATVARTPTTRTWTGRRGRCFVAADMTLFSFGRRVVRPAQRPEGRVDSLAPPLPSRKSRTALQGRGSLGLRQRRHERRRRPS